MITGAVVCPHPPLLLPGAGGTHGRAVLEEIRTHAVRQLRALAATGVQRWVVVGGETAGPHRTHHEIASPAATPLPALAPWPGRDAVAGGPPLSIAVGLRLLVEAAIVRPVEILTVGFDTDPVQCRELGRGLSASPVPTALLVLGDGSARRTRRSPGDFDERAPEFDAEVETALRHGDPAALAALDPALADDLMVAGRAAWQVLAGAFPEPPATAEVFAADPLGVQYFVARWGR